MLRYKTET